MRVPVRVYFFAKLTIPLVFSIQSQQRANKGDKDSSRQSSYHLLPVGTINGPADHQVRSAFKFQYGYFNNISKSHSNFGLNVLENITDISDSFKVSNSICSQMSTGVFLFFGSKDLKSNEIIESLTSEFQIPYVCACLSRVSNPEKNFQIHMKPPVTKAIVTMVLHYRWQNLIYLYDSTEGFQRFKEVMDELFYDLSQEEAILPIQLPDVDRSHDFFRKIDTIRFGDECDTKHIIFDLSSQQAYESVMKQLAEVGMNKHGYFYLFATMDFSKLDFSYFLHGGVNVTGFDLIDSEDKEKVTDFLRRWRIANHNIYPSAGQPLMSEAAMAVDALELITRALTKMLEGNKTLFKQNFRRNKMYNNDSQNRSIQGIHCYDKRRVPWQHGREILQKMKSIKFTGLTGPIAFDRQGFRRDYNIHVSAVGLDQKPERTGILKPRWGYVSLEHDAQTDFFPPYQNGSYKDKVLRITTIMVAPFLQLKKDVPLEAILNATNINDKVEGYAVDLTQILAEKLDFRYEFHLVRDGEFGRLDEETNTWNGMMGELIDGTADMAVAPLTITFGRENVVDFTKPFMDVGISIMIKKPEIEKPGVFSFMKPFSIQVWMFIILAYASVSIGLFIVSRASPYQWKKIIVGKLIQYQNDFSIINSFWFSTGALMLQGSDSCPRSISGRMIGTVWWFFVLIIISTYTANLAAFLTIERLVTPIESADDLARQTEIKYGTIESGSTREFFEKSKVTTYREMWDFMKNNPNMMVKETNDGIKKVRDSKGKYAFLMESTSNEYENSREPCDTMKVGRNLNSKGFGIATPQGSNLRDVLNLKVLELKEDGTLHRLKTLWWHEKTQCSADQESSKKRPLSLSNVAGVFYILIGGLVFAVLFGAIEFTLKRLHLVPKQIYTREREASEIKLLRTPSERENGNLSEFCFDPPEYAACESQDNYTGSIGFEAFGDGNTHTDV